MMRFQVHTNWCVLVFVIFPNKVSRFARVVEMASVCLFLFVVLFSVSAGPWRLVDVFWWLWACVVSVFGHTHRLQHLGFARLARALCHTADLSDASHRRHVCSGRALIKGPMGPTCCELKRCALSYLPSNLQMRNCHVYIYIYIYMFTCICT